MWAGKKPRKSELDFYVGLNNDIWYKRKIPCDFGHLFFAFSVFSSFAFDGTFT